MQILYAVAVALLGLVNVTVTPEIFDKADVIGWHQAIHGNVTIHKLVFSKFFNHLIREKFRVAPFHFVSESSLVMSARDIELVINAPYYNDIDAAGLICLDVNILACDVKGIGIARGNINILTGEQSSPYSIWPGKWNPERVANRSFRVRCFFPLFIRRQFGRHNYIVISDQYSDGWFIPNIFYMHLNKGLIVRPLLQLHSIIVEWSGSNPRSALSFHNRHLLFHDSGSPRTNSDGGSYYDDANNSGAERPIFTALRNPFSTFFLIVGGITLIVRVYANIPPLLATRYFALESLLL